MASAIEAAIAAKADGIAVSLVSRTAFDGPIARALDAGIPVVAYNADAPGRRLAYVGQDLRRSGLELGARIARLVPRGRVALFASTPGSLALRPRIDGALAALRGSGRPVTATVVETGTSLDGQLSRIDGYFTSHPRLAGVFAVDAGSTQGVAQTLQQRSTPGRVPGGGFDLLLPTLQLLEQGYLDFTIGQQPYLQGFYPVVQLFLYRLSGGLVEPVDTDTGLSIVTRANVGRYLRTTTRFEGSSSVQRYPVS